VWFREIVVQIVYKGYENLNFIVALKICGIGMIVFYPVKKR